LAIRGRRNRRFVFEDATVEYRKHSSLRFLAGSPKVSPLINLSVGGLQFITEDYFDPGQRLDLKVIIPSTFRSLSLRAEVVWAKRVVSRDSYRTGVRYLDPSDAAVSLLRSLEEQYWAIPDERKQQMEALVAERYPIQGGEPSAEAVSQPAEAAPPAPEAIEEEPPAPPTAPAPEAAPSAPQAEEPAQAQAERPAEAPSAAEAAPAPLAAAPAQEARPAQPPAEAAAAEPEVAPEEPLRIPVYDLIAGIESKKDDVGVALQGVPKAYIVLPGVQDKDCFALEIHDDSMRHTGSPNFERGDIVLFSPNLPARSGDLAFAITRDGGVFRQVFFDANNVVRLRPLNGWHPEQCFTQGEVKGLWKLIAKYKNYVSE
jgi:phage repressor protein C with HTH and peptisase S24 domain